MDPLETLHEVILIHLFSLFRLEEVLVFGDVYPSWNAAMLHVLGSLKSLTLLLGNPRDTLSNLIGEKFRIPYLGQVRDTANGQLLVQARSTWRDVHYPEGLNIDLKGLFSPANLKVLTKLIISANITKQSEIYQITDYLSEWADPQNEKHLTSLELYLVFDKQINPAETTECLNSLRAIVNNFAETGLENLTIMFQAIESDTSATIHFPILAKLKSFRHFSCHYMSALTESLNEFVPNNKQLQALDVLNVVRDQEELQLRNMAQGVMERFTRNRCLEVDYEAMPEYEVRAAVFRDLCERFSSLTCLHINSNQLGITLWFAIRCAGYLPQLVSFGFLESLADAFEEPNEAPAVQEPPVLASVKVLELCFAPHNHNYLRIHQIALAFPSVQVIDLDITTRLMCRDCDHYIWYRRHERDQVACLRALFAPLRDCADLRLFFPHVNGTDIQEHINIDNVFRG